MAKKSIIESIRKNFFDIKKKEWPNVIMMSLFFFMVIATFWVLKPLKRGLLVNFYQEHPLQLLGTSFAGAEVEQLAKVVNMLVVYVIVVVFTLLSRKLQRQHLNLTLNLFFAGLFILFASLMNNPGPATSWSFYVLGDMFNSAMVTFFWAYSNDIFTSDQAKRTYGIVGLGGIIGGIVGSTVVVGYVNQLGRPTLLYLCLIPLAVMIAIGYYVNSRTKDTERPSQDPCAEGKRCSAIFEGADIVFKSKYLISIVGIIALYEMVSNIVDFQLSATIASSISGDLDKDAYFGFVGQITSIISLAVQLFLTSFVMKRYGVGIALLFLPIAITLGSVGFLVIPSLLFVTIMSASDNSLNYSINQSAKEALYTPTEQDVKYKAKAFIDMFVQRFAKVLAVVLNLAVAAWVGLEHVRWLSIACLIILVFWILAVRYAGRKFEEKADVEEVPV
ncbi:NTP/NDP exchange transporter [Fodinibius sp.]|uniref:NTP/NDP exchange transporter n=1 Tax=Fodinibius sp. TaxID=1872440 RepID=UPI002ACE54BF|nr:Npt1/Npt2 family nucleotide transporter [Fodinibius sp.]MDZ7659016.1 Npt1/Npt2 family nucleotide transporter [Fodinibius sp.]